MLGLGAAASRRSELTMSDLALVAVSPTGVQQGLDHQVVPALVAGEGDAAAWRYVEFFTANIRNPNTRRAYARACGRFFSWCERHGLSSRRDPAVQRRGLYRRAAA